MVLDYAVCLYQIRLERFMCCCVVMQLTDRFCSVVDCDVSCSVKLETNKGTDDLARWSGGERLGL